MLVGRRAEIHINALSHQHTQTCNLWTAGYCVADLLLFRFGVGIAIEAMFFVWCQTPHLPHL